ncbi:SDR family NAD(P)-dependent oxidoreductase [Olivibacter domesticus]|uniref:NAD(P)-dependent dehydrogenase, short-chain alcohol dehydrogenase family n=1 Tax=Olivibacter domesticus TaxID=407022 RepID=A0A1H7K8S9_OLID1|nr:SDR family oxidoreductase [Olivibacter domesticus]SEK82866.1 NAD(P)-dependent dehydrogenase, short-chain alcohol dehydrogenase family [Olivibacter domesticus]
MKSLEGKTILLTGGTDGIGLACATAYVEAGAQLAVIGIDQDSIDRTLKLIGASNHLGLLCDVSIEAYVKTAIARTLERFHKIDVIHNNAGIASPSKPLHETSDHEWQCLFDVNLRSILYTTRYGYKHLKETQGCVINTSSLVGDIGQENHAAYAATKGAMNALTKSMALDYAKDHIRVNAVLPAAVMTPMLKQWIKEQPQPEKIVDFLEDIHPLGYCPEGDVIADACVFLASEKARFITGVTLPVSGGAELGYRRNS